MNTPTVYIVSGGAGASGEQLVHTVLAQFPNVEVSVVTAAHIRHKEQIETIIKGAANDYSVIVHTLVDPQLRQTLVNLARQHNVTTLDVMGQLLDWLADRLGQSPAGRPGLYRKLHQDYFERVEAIEVTLELNDGKNPQDWSRAEIVLVGISRVGKTPLSMYLSVLGWKVANIPLILNIPPAPELFQLDQRRVVGLTINPDKLLLHRQKRQSSLGVSGHSEYADLVKIYEEIEYAEKIMRRGGFSMLNVTDKPIETTADEVIKLITRKLDAEHPADIRLI